MSQHNENINKANDNSFSDMIYAEELSKFQKTITSYTAVILSQHKRICSFISNIKSNNGSFDSRNNEKVVLNKTDLDQLKTIVDTSESLLLSEFKFRLEPMVQMYRFILNSNYAQSDTNREQFAILYDIGKGKLQPTPNHVITYNDQVHYGTQGSQQPGSLNPFHVEDQTAVGSS